MDYVERWGISSAGRAPALQAGGRRFDPVILHHYIQQQSSFFEAFLLLIGIDRLTRLFFKNS